MPSVLSSQRTQAGRSVQLAEAGPGLGSDAATGSRGHAGDSLSSKSKTLKIRHKVLKKKNKTLM